MKSLKGKIISGSITVASVAAVIGFGFSSFAWFSNNKEVQSTGVLMLATNKETVEIVDDLYDVYGYDFILDEPIYLTGDDKNLHLGDYDYFISNRLTYDRRIARMHLRFPSGYTENSQLRIDAFCDSRFLNDDGVTVVPLISNVIQFKFYDNHEGKISDYNSNNIMEVYNECVDTFEDITPYTFVNFTTSGEATTINGKNNTLTVFLDLLSIIEDGKDMTDFIFEINYNKSLIDYFAENCGSTFDVESIKEGDNVITFKEDISVIELALVDKN